MVSSTVAFAAAANFPAPFVQGGAADIAVVYGGKAASTDLVAVTDVTAKLQAELAKQTATAGTTSTGTSVSGGDFVKLSKSSDNMNLGNSAIDVFGATVDDDDLTTLLKDGTYLNDENSEYDYEQKLTLGPNINLTFFADSDYKSKEPTIGIQIGSNKFVMNYSEDFTTDAESDVSSSGDLADFETTDLMLLGKKYYILDAINGTSATNFGKFTMLDSANTGLVTEGETLTIKVGDKSYEVSISFVDSSSTKIVVNGELTNSLSEGETFKISDGTYVGIKDILFNSKDTGISKVEFSIGSGKIEITSGSDIELNDDSINGLKGYVVRGSPTSGKQRLDKIVIEWTTDEEEFITPSQSIEMPGFKSVKLSMGDFFMPAKEVTKVAYDGDNSIELIAPVKDGTARFNILFANSTGEFTRIGADTDEILKTSNTADLLFNETGASTNVDRWFVASWNDTDSSESYLLSATVTESDGRNRTSIKNEVSGDTVCKDKIAGDSCDVGNVALTIGTVFRTGSDKWVNFTAGTGTSFDKLYTKTGLKIALPVDVTLAGSQTADGSINLSTTDATTESAGHNHNSFFLFMTEENKDDDVALGRKFNVTIDDDSDGDLHINDVDTGNVEEDVSGTNDDTTSYAFTDLATKVTRTVTSDRGNADIEYHGSESYADVLLSAPAAVVSSGDDGSSTGVKELGSVSVVDSEVSSVSGKNLIVVGGSCVNTVAADLLGGALCGAAFEQKTGVGAGSFLIETFARSGGKVATLVAGYNAGDTTNAAKYMTTQTVDTTVGKKYTGTSATSASLVTTA